MNQSILFSDELVWDEEQQAVLFNAQCMGALIVCVAPRSVIESLVGEPLENPSQVMAAFEDYRFDLEEMAESDIEDEEYDPQGHIVLNLD